MCCIFTSFCMFIFFVFTIETSQKDNYLRSVFIIVFINLSQYGGDVHNGPVTQSLCLRLVCAQNAASDWIANS
jgi:hypothetical protein